MKIQEIKDFPTSIGNTHESVLQSYQLLKKVKEMVERGDSRETILEVIEFVTERKTTNEDTECNDIQFVGNFNKPTTRDMR